MFIFNVSLQVEAIRGLVKQQVPFFFMLEMSLFVPWDTVFSLYLRYRVVLYLRYRVFLTLRYRVFFILEIPFFYYTWDIAFFTLETPCLLHATYIFLRVCAGASNKTAGQTADCAGKVGGETNYAPPPAAFEAWLQG